MMLSTIPANEVTISNPKQSVRANLDTPAATVSPPRRSKILPMLLFAANVSIGMLAALPEVEERNLMTTLAEEPFDTILHTLSA